MIYQRRVQDTLAIVRRTLMCIGVYRFARFWRRAPRQAAHLRQAWLLLSSPISYRALAQTSIKLLHADLDGRAPCVEPFDALKQLVAQPSLRGLRQGRHP